MVYEIEPICGKNCKELLDCLCCKTPNLLFFDLGNQPLANNYHKLEDECETFPLKLKYCPNCFHCQLSHAVDPEILFKNYIYVSGTSKTGLDFFKENANFINNYKKIKNGKILDIACNDGSQLDFFKELGWNTYGVDPATNLVPIAQQKGHEVICDFWNDDVAKTLPIMDVITAQNVFAHTQYLDEFLKSCILVMDENSSLFIQTSQRNMIIYTEFDTTYHEHISFYNTKSMKTLVERNGLILNRVLSADIHGTSYIFEIKLSKDDSIYDVDKYIEIEEIRGIYNKKTYEEFAIKANEITDNLKKTIDSFRKKGYKCIGFGAAAKSQTVLCYGEINLDYIIDENRLKVGLYTPKQNIPIVDLEHFINDPTEKIVVVIGAWNFAKEIKEKININRGNREIVIIESYFPKISIS